MVFDIKDDILLTFLLLLSPLTSLDIKRLMGYLLLELVCALADASRKGGEDGEMERDKHAASYMKSATTPVWVHSSKRECDTVSRVCV